MKKEVRRSILSGKVSAPSSAALAHRALLIATLTPGQTIVSNVSQMPDIQATIGACEKFGADIVTKNDVVDIFSPDEFLPPAMIDCKESNETLKLFMPLAAIFDSDITFVGTGKLLGNSLNHFVDYFEALLVSAKTQNGHLPVTVKGPAEFGEMIYFPQLGTQFLSGLLIAAPLVPENTMMSITGKMPGISYVEATVEMMKKSGIAFMASEPDFYCVSGPQQYMAPEEIAVPGSTYLSSFLLLAGVLAGKIEVNGVSKSSEMELLFAGFSANIKYDSGRMTASIGKLQGANLDAVEIQQYLMHALVLACFASGETKISNIHKLTAHEDAKMRLMMRELTRMGAKISEVDGNLIIKEAKLSGAEIEPEGDSKVAMACVVAAIVAQGSTSINGAECIEKSYPGFFSDLETLGARIR